MTLRQHCIHILALLVVCLFSSPALPADSPCSDKKIIGQECWVHIEELELDFLARVDTGAATTSLHATDYLIYDEEEDLRDNLGKTINFLTISSDGQYKRMTAEIARIQNVINAQGREKRYMVWLTLTANGLTKTVLANLRDRSRMKYKLLVGRDWLADDFLVDVTLEEETIAEEGEEEEPGSAISGCTPGSPAF